MASNDNYWDILHNDFEKESDRAAAILVVSIADELLRNILVAKLTPASTSSDELFDGANAPLGTFSSRIEMCKRLGIISSKFSRDLHLIRRIRNEFAHNIHGCSFEDTRVKSRIIELNNSHGIIKRSLEPSAKTCNSRGDFLQGCSWMVYHLSRLAENTEAFVQCPEEWGYNYIQQPALREIQSPKIPDALEQM